MSKRSSDTFAVLLSPWEWCAESALLTPDAKWARSDYGVNSIITEYGLMDGMNMTYKALGDIRLQHWAYW